MVHCRIIRDDADLLILILFAPQQVTFPSHHGVSPPPSGELKPAHCKAPLNSFNAQRSDRDNGWHANATLAHFLLHPPSLLCQVFSYQ